MKIAFTTLLSIIPHLHLSNMKVKSMITASVLATISVLSFTSVAKLGSMET